MWRSTAAAKLCTLPDNFGRWLVPEELDEETFGKYLFTAGVPDPDLIEQVASIGWQLLDMAGCLFRILLNTRLLARLWARRVVGPPLPIPAVIVALVLCQNDA